jgi:microsomal dipeptidase-like Zn-dependent dipeptidase
MTGAREGEYHCHRESEATGVNAMLTRRDADDLARRGWTSGRIEKILGRNFFRLFADVWK